MWARIVGVAALAFVAGILPATATNRITGVITSVSDRTVQIRTADKEVLAVALNNETAYVKWITHRPWQEEGRLDSRALTAGRCVQVDAQSQSGSVAKTVWVNLDAVNSMSDPCTSLR